MQISACGVVCSVGLNAVTAGASIRSGLTRPVPIPGLAGIDPDTQEDVPVFGHFAAQIADGFLGSARWLQLLIPCLNDLYQSGELPPRRDTHFWNETRLCIVTPYLDGERYHPHRSCLEPGVRKTVIAPLQRYFQDRGWPREVTLVSRGRIGVHQVVAELLLRKSARAPVRTIVAAVDSWLDGPSLTYLTTMGRLKTSLNPVGFAPGEAAAAVLLEPPRLAQLRRAKAGPRVVACHVGRETENLLTGEVSQGKALAGQIRTVVLPQADPQNLTHIIDLNGEEWRAHEWGMALVRLRGWGIDVSQGPMWVPATSIGDIGAATGVMGLVLAARAFWGGYAPLATVLQTVSDEHGDVGALLMEGRT